MFRSVNGLRKTIVRAKDGEFGSISHFLFDDRTWALRYLVVSISAWPGAKKVLLSPVSIASLNGEGFTLNLTKDQIRHSPDVDTKEPISRRKERELHDYFVWPYYWTTPSMQTPSFGGSYPASGFAGAATHPQQERETEVERASPDEENHLRTTEAVIGYALRSSQDDVGYVSDMLLDTTDWVFQYLIVDTGKALSSHNVILSSQWVNRISWSSREVYVDFDSDTIRNGPGFDYDLILDREQENRIHDYYGQPTYWDKQFAHEERR